MKNEPFPKSIGHHRGAPQSLDDAEGEINLGTQTGLLAVAMVLPARKRLAAVGLVVDETRLVAAKPYPCNETTDGLG